MTKIQMCRSVHSNTEAHMHTRAHACMHCRHTNQICLKCGTLKEERAPVCIKYSCDVLWGAYMCARFCRGFYEPVRVCVCVCARARAYGLREKKSSGKLRRKQPTIER